MVLVAASAFRSRPLPASGLCVHMAACLTFGAQVCLAHRCCRTTVRLTHRGWFRAGTQMSDRPSGRRLRVGHVLHTCQVITWSHLSWCCRSRGRGLRGPSPPSLRRHQETTPGSLGLVPQRRPRPLPHHDLR